jgi:hypothetical protein
MSKECDELRANNERLRLESEELQGEVRSLSLQNAQLQRHLKQKQRFLDKQDMQLEILERENGMDLEGVKGLEAHTSACPQCFRHRDIWRGMRAFNMEQQKQCQADVVAERVMLEQQKRELDLARIKQGRLQIQLDELKKQKNDPLCRVSEIAKLRANIEHGREIMARIEFSARCAQRELYAQIECEKMACCALQEKVSSLEAYILTQQRKINSLEKFANPFSSEARQLFEHEDLMCKLQKVTEERDQAHEHLTEARKDAVHWKEMYDKECLDNHGGCSKIDEEPLDGDEGLSVVSTIGPNDDLTLRLHEQFEIVSGTDQFETCENELYDAFMSSQEPHLHEQILDQMFASCHNGQRLPEKERKRRRLKPNCRSCKLSFSACLKALGGVARKIDKKNYWLNIYQKKPSTLPSQVNKTQTTPSCD